MSLLTTSSHTAGPYLAIGFAPLEINDLAPAGVAGERVTIRGRVVDGKGSPINDGAFESWQADSNGDYASHQRLAAAGGAAPAFRGFGRVLTDADGRFELRTLKPGRVAAPGGGLQAPHLAVVLFMRGLPLHLTTRMYFPDDPANAEDPVLLAVPAERRGTLIARRDAADPSVLTWNIFLQGQEETAFLDY